MTNNDQVIKLNDTANESAVHSFSEHVSGCYISLEDGSKSLSAQE